MAKVTTLLDRGRIKVAKVSDRAGLDRVALFLIRDGRYDPLPGYVTCISKEATDRQARDEALRLFLSWQYYWQ